MKKIFKFTVILLIALFTLASCGGGGGGSSKSDVEKLESNLEKFSLELDDAHFSKFSLEYKIELLSGKRETTKISYDENGYFYYYHYTEDADFPTTEESYVWVDEGVLTYTWSIYRKGIDGTADRRYRYEDYGDDELALERFEEYIFNTDLDYIKPDRVVVGYFDRCLEPINLFIGAYLTNPDNKNTFTINKNQEGNMNFRIDLPKEHDGQVVNPNYNVVIENNMVTSFEAVNYSNHYIKTEDFKFAVAWIFVAPDLLKYTCMN